MFFYNTDEDRKYSELLNYLFKIYLKFDHCFGSMNQYHYTALRNGDPDEINKTNESINKCVKT